MLSFDFWVVMLWILSFGGHTNTYRTVSAGDGAFELCLPSLGFFVTKLTLRCRFRGQPNRMTKVGDLSRHVWSGTLWGVDLIGISCTASSQWRTMPLSQWCRVLCSRWVALIDICCGCIGHSLGLWVSCSRRWIVWAYNLFSEAVVRHGNRAPGRGQSGFTIPYRISRRRC